MVLKEAFRYQNYLTAMINDAVVNIEITEDMYDIVETHNHIKANPLKDNEIVQVPKKEQDYTVTNLIDLIMNLIDEKERLTAAIAETKKGLQVDLDSEISMNKIRQTAMEAFRFLANKKSKEITRSGSGYMINSEGNQVPYYYDINSVYTINYDRNAVKGILKKLSKKSDEVSGQVDLINASAIVNFENTYEVGDTLSDCMEVFLSKK